ncbi:MAG: chemotaxis protein CheW [Aminobacterium sp.]|jgi:purine-binding chemotaxis protein CheW|nr:MULTISPECIES: chemotaxis protein CheW [unclassified Aminobacterium]MDD2207247.1 chemotaxis protein CheW [Aminobacterium sp.]MDD3427075.1 chemotaxis protein CheW [Aminobacterium sp.]MDD3707239.1 chemotaxis protein CheW [Aminobacterium sp.]MDD4229089.1 chemotaxis protein CheW [Aminobacterium sp.]MDD4551919.1 chemotaxis protein CheW [Aminobacterium sp.]
MAEQQLVVFALGKEEFGIEISKVREIVRTQEITKIPQASNFIEGIVNLRGQIVPIVDLCKRFGIGSDEENDEAQRRIIVVNMESQLVGILVDGVSEILRITEESVEAPPLMVAGGMDREFITGVAKVDKRLIIILDLNRVFSFEEQAELEKVNDD